ALYEESLSISKASGDLPNMIQSLEGLATVMLFQAETPGAVRLLGAAHTLCEARGTPSSPSEQKKHDEQLRQAQAALGEAAFVIAWKEGCALPWEQAVALALKEPVASL
ncbi:MAG TPA: hypothetical protein VKU00_25415, partial [Chthonomonadaceae bacterium]|nr:hypothetical protein [Chthonomonadaceae bacterium]